MFFVLFPVPDITFSSKAYLPGAAPRQFKLGNPSQMRIPEQSVSPTDLSDNISRQIGNYFGKPFEKSTQGRTFRVNGRVLVCAVKQRNLGSQVHERGVTGRQNGEKGFRIDIYCR